MRVVVEWSPAKDSTGGDTHAMAHNRIGRRITKTKCKGEYYNEQNKKLPYEIVLWGDFNLDVATRRVAKQLGTERHMIESIEYESYYASMPLETFDKYADLKTENMKFDFDKI